MPEVQEQGQDSGLDGLSKVEAMAASVEAESIGQTTAAVQRQEEQQAAIVASAAAQNAAELMGALSMAKMMVKPMFHWWPDFEKVWSDEQIGAISESGGVIFERHGWSVGGILSEYGPYIGLIAATAPPCVATYGAIKAHKTAQALAAKGGTNGSDQPAQD